MNNIEYIYLDLDGTVYDQGNGLMETMSKRIVKYGREVLGLPQKELDWYYRKYGNTLRGLMQHQHVDAQEYLAYIHDLPLEDYLQPDHRLRRALLSLPQPKWIFTNSWRRHAERTLELLGIADLFVGIVDVESMGYEAKPDPLVYREALRQTGNPDPRTCLFVEDSLANLWPAWEMGWSTVWVSREMQRPFCVEHMIRSLHELPDVVPQPLQIAPLRQWVYV